MGKIIFPRIVLVLVHRAVAQPHMDDDIVTSGRSSKSPSWTLIAPRNCGRNPHTGNSAASTLATRYTAYHLVMMKRSSAPASGKPIVENPPAAPQVVKSLSPYTDFPQGINGAHFASASAW